MAIFGKRLCFPGTLDPSKCTFIGPTRTNSPETLFWGFTQTTQYPGTGNNKVAIGYFASYVNSSNGQTAIGTCALQANTGGNNVAIGYNAMGICGGNGTGNVAIGSYALARATTGNYNVSAGFCNLIFLTTGAQNVSVGGCAGLGVVTTSNSVTIGYKSNTNGNSTVALGAYSCAQCNGSNAIGRCSCALGTDAIAVGSNVYAPANTVNWGNSLHTYNCVWSAWTYISDAREKTDISNLNEELGINLVRKLRPVKYNLDFRQRYVEKCGFEFGEKDGTLTLEKENYGLISQEVKSASEELNVNFEAVKVKPLENTYKLTYTELIPVIVKTIQQIDDRIRQIKNKIEENASI